MKRIIIVIILAIIVISFIATNATVFVEIRQHVQETHPENTEIQLLFSSFLTRIINMAILFFLAFIAGTALWFKEYKKRKVSAELTEINHELVKKQYQMEEQNAVIEELNSQLEDENQRYQQQKESLQAIVDSLGAGIIMVDTEGRIVFINNAWKKLFSKHSYHCRCTDCDNFYINADSCGDVNSFINDMLFGVKDSKKISEKLLSLMKDDTCRYTVDLEQTEPDKRFLNLYSNPCVSFEGHVYGRVFVVRDISHQKEVDRLKLELISTVSHELRTPMSSILGFSELLATRNLTEDQRRQYVDIIHSEAERLTDLVNDFLDIQKIESGKHVFSKSNHSLETIMEESIKLFSKDRSHHRIVYNRRQLPQIYCDRDKILQVMSNLLSNAIKYSPEGGDITITAEVSGHYVIVKVTDQGLGIPEEAKGKLFEKFYRIDNDDRRKIGGTGLGLAICREIIRAHGGQIDADSEYGRGSTFFFSLPVVNDNRNIDINEDNSVREQNNRILIVEDDPSMVQLIKELLKNEGLQMDSTDSGEEAIRLAETNNYRLIILDIVLSERLDGWDVVRALNGKGSSAHIPIIVSSAHENKMSEPSAEISEYLVKPFEPEEFVKLVKKSLNGITYPKEMTYCNEKLMDEVFCALKEKGICVRKIEQSGELLIVTLDGKEGLIDEKQYNSQTD